MDAAVADDVENPFAADVEDVETNPFGPEPTCDSQEGSHDSLDGVSTAASPGGLPPLLEDVATVDGELKSIMEELGQRVLTRKEFYGSPTITSTRSMTSTISVGLKDFSPENADVCHMCERSLGKRYLTRRHHCRMCSRSVCSDCAPSQVWMPECEGLQRACCACVSEALTAPTARDRLEVAGRGFHSIFSEVFQGGGDVSDLAETPAGSTLEVAVAFFEGLLEPLDQLRRRLDSETARADQAEADLRRVEAEAKRQQQAAESLEAKARRAASFIAQLGDQLNNLCLGASATQAPHLCSLEEAIAFCNAALEPTANRLARLQALEERKAPRLAEAQCQTDEIVAPPPAAEDFCSLDNVQVASSMIGGPLVGSSVIGSSMIGSSMIGSSMIGTTASWTGSLGEEDSSACSSCQQKMGKRYGRLRHQCKLCQQVVCAACSPNAVQIEGIAGTQRACTPCVQNALQVPKITERVARLGDRLHEIRDSAACGKSACINPVLPGALVEAVNYCEGAVSPLVEMKAQHEELKRMATAAFQQLEAKAQTADRTRERLRAALGGGGGGAPKTVVCDGGEVNPGSEAFWKS